MCPKRPMLALSDLVPGMKVRVHPGHAVWWHPATRGYEGKVVTVLAREDDPDKVWSDPMAGGVFYVENLNYGFAAAAITEIIEHPDERAPALSYIPEHPDEVRFLADCELQRDFPVEPEDCLRVPERSIAEALRCGLLLDQAEVVEVEEVRAVAWQVRFKNREPDTWWHTRGFLPDFEVLARRAESKLAEMPDEPAAQPGATSGAGQADSEAPGPSMPAADATEGETKAKKTALKAKKTVTKGKKAAPKAKKKTKKANQTAPKAQKTPAKLKKTAAKAKKTPAKARRKASKAGKGAARAKESLKVQAR